MVSLPTAGRFHVTIRKNKFRHMKYLLSALIACLLIPLNVNAQQTITFKDAIGIALKNNNEIKNNWNDIAYNESVYNNRHCKFLPYVEVNSLAGLVTGRSFDQITGNIFTASGRSLDLNLYMEMNLFNGLNNHKQIKKELAQVNLSKHNLARKEQEIMFRVSLLFLNILQAQNSIEVLEENLVYQNNLLKKVNGQVKVERIYQADLYRQEAEVKKIKRLLSMAENTKQNNQLQLMLILGLDVKSDYQFEINSIEDFVTSETSSLNPEELYKVALANRRDYLGMDEQMNIAVSNLEILKSDKLPKLDLFFSYGTDFSSFQQRSLGEQIFKDNLNSTLGVSLRVPVFTRFQNKLALSKEVFNQENLRNNKYDLKNQIFIEVTEALGNYRASLSNLDVVKTESKSLEKVRSVTRSKYELGSADLVELSLVNRDLLEAQLNIVLANVDVAQKLVVLEYALGKLKP